MLEIPNRLIMQIPLAYRTHCVFQVRGINIDVKLFRRRDLPDEERALGASRVEEVGKMELRVRGACHAEDVVFMASKG